MKDVSKLNLTKLMCPMCVNVAGCRLESGMAMRATCVALTTSLAARIRDGALATLASRLQATWTGSCVAEVKWAVALLAVATSVQVGDLTAFSRLSALQLLPTRAKTRHHFC